MRYIALVIWPMAGSSIISFTLNLGGAAGSLEYRFPLLLYCFFPRCLVDFPNGASSKVAD
jgi:hypothetical protein